MRRIPVLLAAVLVASVVPLAHASRAPTHGEKAAIKRVALRACRDAAPDECRFRRARVSTRSARYAWADVVGEGFSAVLLKRPTRHSRRFRVIGTQGGGIGACAYWRRRAPRSVLRDLHVTGLLDISSGTAGSCG